MTAIGQFRFWLFACAAALAWPVFALAQQPIQQDYPSKPVRVIVAAVAGGPFDFIGRTLGRSMQNVMTMAKTLDDPEVKRAFAEQGFVPVGT